MKLLLHYIRQLLRQRLRNIKIQISDIYATLNTELTIEHYNQDIYLFIFLGGFL